MWSGKINSLSYKLYKDLRSIVEEAYWRPPDDGMMFQRGKWGMLDTIGDTLNDHAVSDVVGSVTGVTSGNSDNIGDTVGDWIEDRPVFPREITKTTGKNGNIKE